ncbi:hypothetical protein [Citrobacter braakii]|uniref:hypothetical protein n=1 Tax=Citrobacter braakii TaxID=57706 RepID=UPI0039B4064D
MLIPRLAQVLMGQANVSGERSTVLHAILWVIGILCCMCIALAFSEKGDQFLYIAIALIVIVLLFGGVVFWFCLNTDPDLLRSEKYALQKLTI